MKNFKIFSSYNALILIIVATVITVTYFSFSSIPTIKAAGLAVWYWVESQDPMIAGAMSLWMLGVITIFAKGVPALIWRAFVKQSTVSLTFNNVDEVYNNFLRWYFTTGRSAKSRTLIAKNENYGWVNADRGVDISAGYGTHYFIFDNKIFKLFRELKEANNTKDVKETIVLTTIGRSQEQFHKLLKDITPEDKNTNFTEIRVWNLKDGYWKLTSLQPIRKFETVILPKASKTKLMHHIDEFFSNRDWYISHGIPYRTGILLHGVPGTGKTSIVKGLCAKYNKPLHILSLNMIHDKGVEDALVELPRNAIILIEDIDAYSVTQSRADSKNGEGEDLQQLTLSGLLNAIDGVMSSDGRILIATTNHREKLDAALVRKGRINLCVSIDYLTDEGFGQFFESFYPEFTLPIGIKFKKDISPAEAQGYIMDNIKKPENVLQYFRKHYIKA